MVTEKAMSELQQLEENATVLTAEMEWLRLLIDTRLRLYFGHESGYKALSEVAPPALDESTANYAQFVKSYGLETPERMVLALALAPHVKPEVLDGFYAKNETYDKPFTEFGGIRGQQHAGFIPTAETAFFLFAGTDMKKRLLLNYVFGGDFVFARQHILRLESPQKGEPRWSGRLAISQDYIEYLTVGTVQKPDFSPDFPAKLVTTDMNWEDVVLPASTLQQVEEIRDWVAIGQQLLKDPVLGKKLKPGYKSLFYGPPGTGKTLTATLLGKVTNRDVYKIDLSLMVSKYIGETEKNLAKVFDQAENKQWILFFDEADALFGKRTEMSSSHDRFANQEVAYLLQRIEDFSGVVILASNLRENIDVAFSRRFQSVIHFPLPGVHERKRLWTTAFSDTTALHPHINLAELATKYEMSGGLMMNVVRYCTVKALKREDKMIFKDDVITAIRREFRKDGVVLV